MGTNVKTFDDAESMVDAIVKADTEGRIRLTERPGGIRGALSKLRRRGNS